MNKSKRLQRLAHCALSILALHSSFLLAADLPSPTAPVRLTGTKGKFDFLAIDVERRRLLAAHTGNGSLDVIDLDKGELVKSIATGVAQDCAVDRQRARYLVSVSKPPQLAIIDAEKLELTGVVSLQGPADLLALNGVAGLSYVGHGDGQELWVVDPNRRKVVATVKLPSDSPEGLAFDATGERLFQAMKTASTLTIIKTATQQVIGTWPTAPAASPHGIALVPESEAIAIAGGNGKVVLMSQKDGRILSAGEIPLRADQIAYDGESHRLYCASALGRLAVFTVTSGQLEKLGEITTNEGAHSVAIDPKTHTIWIAYAQGEESFVRGFRSSK